MLQTKELRIGNYVTIDNPNSWLELADIPMEVFAIENYMTSQEKTFWAHSDGKIRVKSKYETYSQFSQFIAPIPLNEEWLLKFAFNPTTDGYWSNGKLEIGYTTSDENIQYEFISITHKTEMSDLKFVHQLQNLFYALTGEELTLNK